MRIWRWRRSWPASFEYVATVVERNLNLDIEWLHLASTLIQWKSRSLLPRAPEDADPIREELVRQLVAHHKDVAADLARRRKEERLRFSRKGNEDLFPETVGANSGEDEPFVSVWDLLQQARDLAQWAAGYRLERAERKRSPYVVSPEEVTLDQMRGLLLERLTAAGKTDVTALVLEQPSAAQRTTLFLAALELVRDQTVWLERAGVWAPIFGGRRQH